ncbi:MAG TPA: APC family permease [Candidatus Angelobacter sp.]|nr:APC family permease [Candidatus Angelobacter sp.]
MANEVSSATPVAVEEQEAPHLKRVLTQRDLVLLIVVAIVNLNFMPTIAANGGVTVWLWILALLLFFWPQGVAVIELSYRFPQEGGIYLWTKRVFGDFHGFLSGWCYWTNNIFYVPTVLLTFVGISVYVAGPRASGLADNHWFALGTCMSLLLLLVILNVLGLGVGKWVNNLGGIGTFLSAVTLIGLGILVFSRFGTTLTAADFRIPGDVRLFGSFGVICFGLVGLELASIMGDEIQDPRRTLPGAVAWGGLLCGILFIGVTLTLLLAVPRQEIGVLQGVPQAVTRMAEQVKAPWIVPPFAFVLSISIVGIASAWLAGSARIPFVAGLDSYLPEGLGKIHSAYGTPYVALIVHGTLSAAFLAMSFVGAGVKEAFVTMLDLAVVLQLIPFLYVYAALLKLAKHASYDEGRYSKAKLLLAGSCGLVTTTLGIGVAFIPSHQIESIRLFELKMCVGTLFFIGLAAFFFFVYGRRKAARKLAAAAPAL